METEILRKLVAISTAIYEARVRDDLFAAVDDACASLGFDRFILSCDPTTRRDVMTNATLTTFPDDYRHDYDRLGWFDGDMHTARALEAERAFFWNSDEERYRDVRHQGYIDFLKASRMKNGVVVPMRRKPGAISLLAIASLYGVPATSQMEQAASILADFALGKAEQLGLSRSISADEAIALRSLSNVQHSVLSWIAEGKSNIDIATILGIPERTARHHVSEVLRKLGVVSRNQAAAIMRSGTPPASR